MSAIAGPGDAAISRTASRKAGNETASSTAGIVSVRGLPGRAHCLDERRDTVEVAVQREQEALVELLPQPVRTTRRRPVEQAGGDRAAQRREADRVDERAQGRAVPAVVALRVGRVSALEVDGQPRLPVHQGQQAHDDGELGPLVQPRVVEGRQRAIQPGEVAWAHGGTADRDLPEPGVPPEHAEEAGSPGGEPGPPVPLHRLGRRLLERRVCHEQQQLVLAADVPVERHGGAAELRGDPGHRHRGQPLGVGDPHRGGLVKTYGDRRVLDGVTLGAAEGTVLALLGPNGAGKTTTVRILATLTRPDGGSARVGGHDVVGEPVAVRSSLSLTGQFAAVDDQQTGRENLAMIGRLRHLGRAGAARRADELLERFDLTDAADRRVGTWSGGMRRRLDLAMSLVVAPRLLVLDEPTTGLDPVSRATMWTAIGDLVRDGTTLLLTTQYLDEADRLADRVVLLARGRVVAEGTTDELKARVGGERLVLRFADTAAQAAALDRLARDGARPDGALALALPSDGGADHVRRVLDELHLAGIPVARVGAVRPTLDDVFVELTGARPAAEPVPA
ncbi:UNVERIFIED_ORG: ATP-binding cassette domain-containing protein [Bacillus sp. AZ43]